MPGRALRSVWSIWSPPRSSTPDERALRRASSELGAGGSGQIQGASPEGARHAFRRSQAYTAEVIARAPGERGRTGGDGRLPGEAETALGRKLSMFRKILIANRGEIAVRVIRACRELGIGAVAVYSEADRARAPCPAADEAVFIGPPPAGESYLDMDRIVAAARATGAEAVHPGYGFLAENARVRPPPASGRGSSSSGRTPAALELVGDKAEAAGGDGKGGHSDHPRDENAPADGAESAAAARRIGFPVHDQGLGRRRRQGHEDRAPAKKTWAPALEAGRREAKAAFGDDAVYLREVHRGPAPRGVPGAGRRPRASIVHLFERECSIQRRHQKIVEESPSLVLDPRLRASMGATASEVLRVAGYNNAGTVEFLMDKDKNFYFLEVNARLQVEHPVTELTAGVDLVQQQIRIAAGERLGLTQDAPGRAGMPSNAVSTPRTRRTISCRHRAGSWRTRSLPGRACGSTAASTPAGAYRSIMIPSWRSSSSGRRRASWPAPAWPPPFPITCFSASGRPSRS